MTNRKHARARAGFTLIEVMIVIAIVIAITGLVAVNLIGQKDRAKVELCRIDMNNLKAALKTFRLEYDRYPKDEEGLKVLWDKSTLDPEADEAKWRKFLEEPLANDRWGSPWGYRQASEQGDETMYDLWSIGPDKQEGTEDDIVSWTKEGEGGESGSSDSGSSSSGS